MLLGQLTINNGGDYLPAAVQIASELFIRSRNCTNSAS